MDIDQKATVKSVIEKSSWTTFLVKAINKLQRLDKITNTFWG